MISHGSFYVFEKWKNAPPHAFGSGNRQSIVPSSDKEEYNKIFNELMDAAAFFESKFSTLQIKKMGYSPEYGSRGHRPVDLWVSLCGANSKPLSQMPQIYAIASDRGLEVGFAVSIDEADYHDPEVKARNRLVVPMLVSKLPEPDDQRVLDIDEKLKQQGAWHFNTKTRLTDADDGFDSYQSLADMIKDLKRNISASGGGTVCRIFSIRELEAVDLSYEFSLAVSNFLTLIEDCAPSESDTALLKIQAELRELIDPVAFDPIDAVDARRKVLAEVARRQGQNKFRNALLKAYEGRCAISGTNVSSVLQAAHITPYLGPKTNHVTNGLLLRADIHSLFDLKLIKILPSSNKIEVAEVLQGTEYWFYNGKEVFIPSRPSERPSQSALNAQYCSGDGNA